MTKLTCLVVIEGLRSTPLQSAALLEFSRATSPGTPIGCPLHVLNSSTAAAITVGSTAASAYRNK